VQITTEDFLFILVSPAHIWPHAKTSEGKTNAVPDDHLVKIPWQSPEFGGCYPFYLSNSTSLHGKFGDLTNPSRGGIREHSVPEYPIFMQGPPPALYSPPPVLRATSFVPCTGIAFRLAAAPESASETPINQLSLTRDLSHFAYRGPLLFSANHITLI
jgi:hypothetical protein